MLSGKTALLALDFQAILMYRRRCKKGKVFFVLSMKACMRSVDVTPPLLNLGVR